MKKEVKTLERLERSPYAVMRWSCSRECNGACETDCDDEALFLRVAAERRFVPHAILFGPRVGMVLQKRERVSVSKGQKVKREGV